MGPTLPQTEENASSIDPPADFQRAYSSQKEVRVGFEEQDMKDPKKICTQMF